METLLRRIVRRSRVTGLGSVLLLSLVFVPFALAATPKNPFPLAGGGEGQGTITLVQNINRSVGALEDNRFGAVTRVSGAENGRFDLTVSGSGEVAKGLFANRKTCTMPPKTKTRVSKNDFVETECTIFQADRLATATVRGTHIWKDRRFNTQTRFDTSGKS